MKQQKQWAKELEIAETKEPKLAEAKNQSSRELITTTVKASQSTTK